jgi:hypothetical protein
MSIGTSSKIAINLKNTLFPIGIPCLICADPLRIDTSLDTPQIHALDELPDPLLASLVCRHSLPSSTPLWAVSCSLQRPG